MTLSFRSTIAAPALALALGVLSACGGPAADVSGTPEPLGDFRLGHNIVVVENAKQGPLSRSVPAELIKEQLTEKLQERLGVYKGSRLYHIGVNLDGYILAVPGVPVVASPKSVMVISVNVWDDAKGRKINEPQQITVLEEFSGDTIVGSGLTKTKEEQLDQLTDRVAIAVEAYLRRNPQWFRDNPPAAAASVSAPAAATPAVAIRPGAAAANQP